MKSYWLFFSHFILSLTFFGYLPVAAQQSSCPNADFELNSFAGWSGTTGTCCPINSTFPGIVPGRHTIMTGPGTDPNTNNQLSVVAPGGNFSVRLGNDFANYQAEQLRYSFLVTPQTALFIYRYAVVLQDPGHDPGDQPRFEIRVFDQNGDIDSVCGMYSVVAAAGIPGFQTIVDPLDSTNTVHWKNWTSVGIDLTSKMGSVITIEFSTGDCNLGAHYGYAYIDCMCFEFNVRSDFCPGNLIATLTAPSGFTGYQWSTGETTQSINIVNPLVGDTLSVILTSVTGCQVVLNSILHETSITAAFNVMDSCFNSASFMDSSYVDTGSPVNNWLWNFADGTFSNLQSPTHVFPWPANYNVTLIVSNDGGCRDSVTHPVFARDIPHPGFTSPPVCPNQPLIFTDTTHTTNGNIISWAWNFGDGSGINSSQNPAHIYNLSGTYYVTLTLDDVFGCRGSTAHQVITYASPTAVFSVPEGCPNAPISFTSLSNTGTGGSETWIFGDGSLPVSGNSVTHLFATGGGYNVTLYVSNSNGCTDSVAHMVYLPVSPVANFSAVGNCVGKPTLFTSTTPNIPSNIIGWNWNFGDGSAVDTNQFPAHIFYADSLMTITLAVLNANGCRDTASKIIFIQPLPKAGFTIHDKLCEGAPIHISDSSFSPTGISQYNWNFGDGLTATGLANPVHAFVLPGNYTVSLVAIAGNGCVDSVAVPVVINRLPKVYFAFQNVCESTPMQFQDQSVLNNGVLVQWNWNFGDGTSDTLKNPSHVFNSGGVQHVQLEVTGNTGCKNDSTLDAYINPNPQARFAFGNICKSNQFTFIEQSTITVGYLKFWYWTFGDGSSPVSIQSPVHTYIEDTTFTVALTVSSDSGCVDTTSKTVLVHALPSPLFTTDSVCLGELTTFINLSTVKLDTIQYLNWNFGDGGISLLGNPQHIYNTAGLQTIKLTTTTNYGCVDSVSISTKVYHLPIPDFISNIRQGCEALPVSFTDQSLSQDGIIKWWYWDFGDGGSDTLQNPDYIYKNDGLFNVQLTVSTSLNCSANELKPSYINVHPLPKAGFNYTPEKPDLLAPTVTFHDQSIGASQWFYHLGDGTTSTEADPVHLYHTIGLYKIIQAVETQYGCRDTAYGEVYVDDVFTLYIPNSFTPDNDGINDVFKVYGTGIVDYFIRIFNRWGDPIYESGIMSDGWDGQAKNGSALQDVYFYVVEVKDVFNKKHTFNGRVTALH